MSAWLDPRRISTLLAVAFLLPGIAGFIPNPLIGPNGLFAANAAHNLVHLVTAAMFFLMATRPEAQARRFMQVFGVVYLLVGALGVLVLGGAEETMLLGFIHINAADNILHVGLGAVIAFAGFGLRSPKPASADSR